MNYTPIIHHTPGPWAQGRVLSTPYTQRYTATQWAEADAREKLNIFSRFDTRDEGCSRQLVATFRTPEDARLGAAAPQMLQALRKLHAELIQARTQHPDRVPYTIETCIREIEKTMMPLHTEEHALHDAK